MLPTFETSRLILRPRRLADLDACFSMDREAGTLDWIDWPAKAGSWDDETAHRAFIEARIDGPYPPGLGYWVIARRGHPDEFLGWVLLIPEDVTGPEIEIGWRVPISARGEGYASEAAQHLLDYGLGMLGLARIIADIYPENTASCRVAQKIGMHPTGPTPDAAHLVRYVGQQET